MTSWQVRLATALAWVGVLPGVGCLALVVPLFRADPGFLFAVMPFVIGGLLMAGVVLVSGAVQVAVHLGRRHPQARLETAMVGVLLVVVSVFAWVFSPLVGLACLLYGGTQLGLMLSAGAARDLGPWGRAFQAPTRRGWAARSTAPWGARPGTGVWVPAERSPELRPVVPAGPVQRPWWQTWQAGLAQGIPLWELLLLCVALLGWLVGVVGLLLAMSGTAYLGTLRLSGRSAWLVLLLPGAWALLVWLERRMRERLATRG